MARQLLHSFFALAALSSVQAYFLVGNRDILVTERLDPIINPGAISGHAHSIVGGSNFGSTLSTASLRNSECTTMPIQEDKSNYWFPHLYFQHKNGSFSSLTVGNVIRYLPVPCLRAHSFGVDYLFNDAENGQPNTVKAFPDDFRMISGDMTLRSYNASSYAQQAVTFLCLDFNGVSTKYNELPPVSCPSGIRAQINFPMCWDGKNLDSSDHKSHVAFPSGGADSGTCNDPNFPVTLPRIFIEGYWATGDFDAIRNTDAMNSTQPYVFAHGDPTGYGYHADFYNGWKSGVLQNVLDKCACTSAGFGDATCCGDLGVFTLETSGSCGLTPIVDETVLGTLPALPGNNPVRYGPAAAPALAASSVPAILAPAYAYTDGTATATGTVVSAASSATGAGAGSAGAPANPTSASSVQASAVSGSSGSASANSAPASASASAASASGHSSQASVSASSSQAGETSATIPPPAHGASSAPASGASASASSNVAVVAPASSHIAVVFPTSNSGSGASVSSNVAVAVPTSASGSGHDCDSSSEGASATLIVSDSVMAASSSSASFTIIPASAFPSSAIASSAGYTILPASALPASPSASASGAASSSSSDDGEYEYYCERRPKRKNSHRRSLTSSSSKVRQGLHHNVHRRLSDNDF
ncbi:hypothetical protein D9757_013318 [Collybiopsis confluens]|uniref:DUF1996 domain-containing protein n=1 Tax=Collybiopsis confluens TaxID=2823264 RepID=A0A8H5LME0_9AGAR|nr:hypothetical protein D9757_013318 [Collybiopsis confluens]